MAIYQAGYLSPIKNKLGNAVGRRWRNLNVLSVYNGTPRNPRSTRQQLQRTKFAALARLAMSYANAANIGFAGAVAGTKNFGRSMFMKQNYKFVHSDTPGSATIDYEDLLLSQGSLTEADFGAASFSNPLEINVTNTDNSGVGTAKATDKLYVFAYCPEGQILLEQTAAAVRSDASVKITCPAFTVGQRAHVYGFAVSEDGEKTSATRYLGTGTIS